MRSNNKLLLSFIGILACSSPVWAADYKSIMVSVYNMTQPKYNYHLFNMTNHKIFSQDVHTIVLDFNKQNKAILASNHDLASFKPGDKIVVKGPAGTKLPTCKPIKLDLPKGNNGIAIYKFYIDNQACWIQSSR
ncbi:MAG: hypothetical protein K0S11_1521 [Gammaproteobacteria bacterium]|jgi:hypothetical protein|nr:hypothetical protein [Gammaproteobacteria bacterium]